jgi:hypothetical protein
MLPIHETEVIPLAKRSDYETGLVRSAELNVLYKSHGTWWARETYSAFGRFRAGKTSLPVTILFQVALRTGSTFPRPGFFGRARTLNNQQVI